MPLGKKYKGRTSATLKDFSNNPTKRKEQDKEITKRRKSLGKKVHRAIYGR